MLNEETEAEIIRQLSDLIIDEYLLKHKKKSVLETCDDKVFNGDSNE